MTEREVICLCGSTRFKDEYRKENARLTMEGKIVISVGLFGHSDDVEFTEEEKEMLDAIHKDKIDLSDRIHVINVDGYVGSSTRSEIRYARENGVEVTYLEPFIQCPECEALNDVEAVQHQACCHDCREEFIA